MSERTTSRSTAFGEGGHLSSVDRFGVWLSKRRIERVAGPLTGKDIGDFGCGFNASLVRPLLDHVRSAVLVDLALAPDVFAHPKVTALQANLPDAMADIATGSLDLVLCMSVIEHLWEPERTLIEFHRVLRPGGKCLINVPSWRGKAALEFSAFKLGLSPVCEMDDHKMYYDPRDLWPLLVRAGFRPHAIKCFSHKFTLNTFAVCTKVELGAA